VAATISGSEHIVTRSRFAWLLFGAEVALAIAGTFLEGRLSSEALFGLAFMGIALIGALVASRLPDNRIGWVFLGVTGFSAVGYFTGQYALQAFEEPGSLPFAEFMLWVSGWAWFPGMVLLIVYSMLLFPDGHLPSPAWRWLARAAGLVAGLMVLAVMFMPGPIYDDETTSGEPLNNPYGIEAADGLEGLFGIGFPLLGLMAIGAAGSLFYRYFKGTPIERQQLKLFGFAGLLTALIVALEAPLNSALPEVIAEGGFLVALFTISAAAGMAIFKYRLYDIDLVINKTLVYLVLSAVLALIYFGGVALLQSLIGLDEDNELAVAASTLAVAALFQPLRLRIQGFIDHHFYKRKYDARKTIDEFSSRLRDEIDLSTLNDELLGIVDQTMQPRHVSVWLVPEVRA
jgi:hypothetical protein